MAARGNDRVAARNRARERRLALDADRRRRDERVDVAVADFDIASAERAAALAAVTACEVAMGSALLAVLAEGESMERAAALCEVNLGEVRRMTRLASDQADNTGAGEATSRNPSTTRSTAA